MTEQKQAKVRIKITDDVLKGVYANQMMVSHTREEFVIDWVNMLPPEGVVNARVITSPSHIKRVIRALQDNVRQYEERFGAISEGPEPPPITPSQMN